MAPANKYTFEDRRHFFAYCSGVSGSILVDLARESDAARHGGGLLRITLSPDLQDELSDAQLIYLTSKTRRRCERRKWRCQQQSCTRRVNSILQGLRLNSVCQRPLDSAPRRSWKRLRKRRLSLRRILESSSTSYSPLSCSSSPRTRSRL